MSYSNQISNVGNSISLQEYITRVSLDTVRTPKFRLEFLHKLNDKTMMSFEDYVTDNSGSVNITNNTGSRRGCNFVLRNFDNEFTDFVSNISIGDKFKVYLGYDFGGDVVYFPQGVYCYSEPVLNSSGASKTINISGTDKWSLLDGTNGGILDVTYQVNKGSSIGDFIKRTLTLDIVRDFVPPNIDSRIYDLETTYDIIHESGATVADVILEVAFNLSCYVYYDENGVFTIRPFEYDSELATVFSFNDRNVTYISGSKTLDLANIYNAVKLVAENSQNEYLPIIGYLENKDPSDPNSTINDNPLKIKHITEYVEGIDTQEKADERVRYELKKAINLQSFAQINALSVYHILENTIITINDDYLDSDEERFLVNGITFNIGSNATMSLDVSKASKYL